MKYALTAFVLDWNFLLDTKQLPKYTEWLDIRLQEKYDDEAWMKQFEQFSIMQAKKKMREVTAELRQAALRCNKRTVLTTYSPATPARKSSRKGM